ncbi:unnamed protein product [Microthlaspi erraticum]|uniref:RRM domain-containing protein n=1 Tax=Microthlaspi erraticum TaxID=1685480 RepID=A0A6D2KB58_9BRAS|nr:unnamed protein product [Microthlaspi erraticum]
MHRQNRVYILNRKSYWVTQDAQRFSKAIRGMLQLQPLLSTFLKCEVGNGKVAAFWWDSWTSLGPLVDFIGQNGPRMLRLPLDARVSDATRGTNWHLPNARSDSVQTLQILLTTVPVPLEDAREDLFLWRNAAGNYTKAFSSSGTWDQLCVASPQVPWSKMVWFRQGIPIESFFHSLACQSQEASNEGSASKLGHDGASYLHSLFAAPGVMIISSSPAFSLRPFGSSLPLGVTSQVLPSRHELNSGNHGGSAYLHFAYFYHHETAPPDHCLLPLAGTKCSDFHNNNHSLLCDKGFGGSHGPGSPPIFPLREWLSFSPRNLFWLYLLSVLINFGSVPLWPFSSSQMASSEANLLGKRKPEDDLEMEPIPKKQYENSEEKETMKRFADTLQQITRRVELLEKKFDHANLISAKEKVEVVDETLDFVEEAVEPMKTLFVSNLSQNIRMLDIVVFFKSVAQVVRVRIIVTDKGKRAYCAFVEFASADEAKKALQEKNGEYLYGRKVFLEAADKGARYVDYLERPKEKDETETLPYFGDEKVVFVANLSPQTKQMFHIINFFKDVGEVVGVRLIVNHEGKHAGYGFVEFASANEAKQALNHKNGKYLHDHKVFLMEGPDKTPDCVELAAVRNKTLFVENLSHGIGVTDIITFFKDAGEVVHVRLNVDPAGKHLGSGLVEFASASEAKKARKEKNGASLHDSKIVVKRARYPCPPKFSINHYVRDEETAVEEVDETPDFAEHLKICTLVLGASFACTADIFLLHFYSICFFKDVGQVVGARLVVDHWGKPVGCAFVEFASASEAEKALKQKNGKKWGGYKMFVDVAEIAPYPFRPKHKRAEELWCQDYLRRESHDFDAFQSILPGEDEDDYDYC